MKKMVSIAMVLIAIMSSHVSAKEISETLDARQVEMRPQMMLESYIGQFEGNAAQEKEFLDAVAQKTSEGEVIDDAALRELFKGIKYRDAITYVLSGGKAAAKLAAQNVPVLRSNSAGEELLISDAVFTAGFGEDNEVISMRSGVMGGRFTLENNANTPQAIMAIVRLLHSGTNTMVGVVIVEKTIDANSRAAITTEFDVPDNAQDYEIKIELWDDNMNLLNRGITFPEPHARFTVSSGSDYLDFYAEAEHEFTLEYNGKIESFVSNGAAVGILIESELINTPVIIKGNLTSLFLSNNRLTSFQATKLSSLTYLNLSYNYLISCDVSGLPLLTNLHLGENQLTSFDASGLPLLTVLNLYYNQLTSFDASGLPLLTTLYLGENQLTSFDASGLPSLTALYLGENRLTSFDASGLPLLTTLYLSENQLTSFDASGLPLLTTLYLGGNQLISFDASGLPLLTTLDLGYNQLTSFDASGLPLLTRLYLLNNPLTSLVLPNFTDVPSGNGGFRYLYLNDTNLGNLPSLNSVWNSIIDSLPTRNNSYKGTVSVNNATLKDLLRKALASKYWTA